MSKPKLPHELSINELLDSLEGINYLDIPVEKEYDSLILSFIQAFDLLPGKELVSDNVLLRLFKFWNKGNSFSLKRFNSQMGMYLPSVIKNRRYYTINSNLVEFTNKIQTFINNKKQVKSRSKIWKKHFEKFIKESKLKPGSIFIEADIFFYIYNRWLDHNRKKSGFGYNTFVQMCDLYFERKILSKNNNVWFGLNPKIKDLITEEEVKRWRQGRLRFGKTRSENKEKISSSEKKITIYPKKEKKK